MFSRRDKNRWILTTTQEGYKYYYTAENNWSFKRRDAYEYFDRSEAIRIAEQLSRDNETYVYVESV